MLFAVTNNTFSYGGKVFKQGDWYVVRVYEDVMDFRDFFSGNNSIKMPRTYESSFDQGTRFRRGGYSSFNALPLSSCSGRVVMTTEVRIGMSSRTGFMSITFNILCHTITIRTYLEDEVVTETLSVPQQVGIYFPIDAIYYDLKYVQPFVPSFLDVEDEQKEAVLDNAKQSEEPETALVVVSGGRKCLPPCCIQ